MTTHPVRQASFVGGEISPERYADSDKPHYLRGLRTCRNVIPAPYGEAVNRPGTKFIAAVKDSTKKPRLVPFIFSDGQSFVLELGDFYVRFFTLGGQVLNAGLPYEIASPWAIADVDRLKFSQVGDIIVATHPSYAPRDISRITNTNWTITATSITSGAGTRPWVATPGTFDSVQWFVAAAYSAAVNYAVNDIRTEGAFTYKALQVNGPASVVKAPGANPDYWALHGWNATVVFSEGDYVYFDGILYLSLQYRNVNHDPTASPTWWAAAADTSRPQREQSWLFTFIFKDLRGTEFESLPILVPLSSPSGKWPLSADRPAKLSAITSPLGGVAFFYVITGVRWYRGRANLYGWVGDTASDGTVAGTAQFKDDGQAPDFHQQPPTGTNPFVAATGAGAFTLKYPAVVTHDNQRRVFARNDAEPSALNGSAVANFSDFDRPIPVTESDAYKWKLASDELEEIRAAKMLGRLLVFTGTGEWSVYGQQGDSISALSVNARRHSKHGISWLDPIVVGNHVLFITVKGNRVRSQIYDFAFQTFSGQDLTVHGRHLVKNRTIVDWAYQKEPFSLIWAVRDDGVLLTLTFDMSNPQAPILAWARHDTAAGDLFERVCCVPETTVDSVYFQVKRQGGRYVEQLAPYLMPAKPNGDPDDVRFAVVLDAALAFDGRNTNAAINMQLVDSGGSTWVAGTQAYVVGGGAFAGWVAGDVGSEVVFEPDGSPFRATIKQVISPTFVLVELQSTLTAGQQVLYVSMNTTKWGLARTVLTGLGHLEGRSVTVLGDGVVQGPFVVAGGQAGPIDPSLIAQVGLGYNCDVEVLDVPGTVARTAVKAVEQVEFEVAATRGLSAGPDFDHLKPALLRTVDDSYGAPALVTGRITMKIGSGWSKGGRACMRQSDPLPFTLLSVTREVVLGGKS